VYHTHLVRGVVDGASSAKPYWDDLVNDLVGITPLDETLAPPGAAAAVAAARQRIMRGEFDVFEGVMMTNDGRLAGAPGVSDEEIATGVNGYYHSIVEP
jgi:basic membrane protein A